MLAFAILKYLGILTLTPSTRLLLGGGALTGFLSGLIGSAGPLGAAVSLSLGLSPVAYVASEATTAVVMHAVKTVGYGTTLSLDGSFWGLAALLGAAMVAGTWAANRFLRRVSTAVFERYVLVLLGTLDLPHRRRQLASRARSRTRPPVTSAAATDRAGRRARHATCRRRGAAGSSRRCVAGSRPRGQGPGPGRPAGCGSPHRG